MNIAMAMWSKGGNNGDVNVKGRGKGHGVKEMEGWM